MIKLLETASIKRFSWEVKTASKMARIAHNATQSEKLIESYFSPYQLEKHSSTSRTLAQARTFTSKELKS